MMFSDCRRLSKLDLSNWDVSNIIDMTDMFWNCNSLDTLPDWYQKYNQKKLTEDLVNFNPSDYDDNNIVSNSEINNLLIKYRPNSKLKLYEIILDKLLKLQEENIDNPNPIYELDLTDIDVSEITDMGCLFGDVLSSVRHPVKLDISNWNTSNVFYMNHMFNQCRTLIEVNVSNFNTSNVIYMDYMFCNCESLKKLDLSEWDISKVTNMNGMFKDCHQLAELNLSGFNTHNVINMNSMFKDCWVLKDLDVSHFDTTNLVETYQMFAGCESLIKLDLSNFDFSDIVNTNCMFERCTSLSKLILPDNQLNPLSMYNMFKDCPNLKDIPGWYKKSDSNNYNKK